MSGILQDIRYALRQLRKSPGFFSIVVLTLGLGIGANTAIFSMVDWLILRPLPISNPDQMHYLAFARAGENSGVEFSYPEFVDVQKQTTEVFSTMTPFVFGGLMGAQNSQDGLTVNGVTKPIQTAFVGGDFFPMMGITPVVGWFIAPTEGKAAGADPLVVLSYNYWQTRFGGDPAIVGTAAKINGHPVTVIGIARKGFLGPTPLIEVQAYLPLGMYGVERGVTDDFLINPNARSMLAFTRVRPGVAIDRVQAVLGVVGRHLLEKYPRQQEMGEFRAVPLRPPGLMSGGNPMPKLAGLFLTLAALVLGLACVNVANLFLVRAAARQREMAVRAALGAASSRLVRQLLIEGIVVAICGYIVGLVIGLAAVQMLRSVPLQSELPFALAFGFNWHVFAYAFAVAGVTAILVILVPAVRVWHGNLRDVLHEGGRTATSGRQRLRTVLVTAQVGGSLTLLIIAGLFVRSLRSVQSTELGFDPSSVLNLTIDTNEIGYTEAQGRDFYRQLLERARALPGVQSASLASVVPLSDSLTSSELVIPGYDVPKGHAAPSAQYNAISTGYFGTMSIGLNSGRDFSDTDNENSARVGVINQAMAARYWPGQDPVGKSFTMASDAKHPITIVGVVQNSRMGQLYGAFDPIFYLPIKQSYAAVETLQIRSRRGSQELLSDIRRLAESLAPTVPIYGVRTMTDALHGGNGLLLFELGAGLAAALGSLGLVLAIVGVYGVLSYSVSQRTQEIGIRIALGAQRRDILAVIGRQGLLITAAGMTFGLIAAFAVSRLVSVFLVGITPVDPITYIGVSASLIVVAGLAMYLPARRAAMVDPMVALRYE